MPKLKQLTHNILLIAFLAKKCTLNYKKYSGGLWNRLKNSRIWVPNSKEISKIVQNNAKQTLICITDVVFRGARIFSLPSIECTHNWPHWITGPSCVYKQTTMLPDIGKTQYFLFFFLLAFLIKIMVFKRRMVKIHWIDLEKSNHSMANCVFCQKSLMPVLLRWIIL